MQPDSNLHRDLSASRRMLRFENLNVSLPRIFLLLSVPLAIFLAIGTPPFQSPDELVHFKRSYQITIGQFFGGNGGIVDTGIDALNANYERLPFHSTAKVTPDEARSARTVEWSGVRVYRVFSNPATYPPIGYIPQALGVAIGRLAGLTVLHTVMLARLLNAACAILLSFAALRWCRRGRLLMFALLLLPMTLSLFASCSQDATMIAIAALAAALVSRQLERGSPLTRREALLFSAMLLVLCLERPAYAPLLLLLVLPGLLPHRKHVRGWVTGAAVAMVIVVFTMMWWLAAMASTKGIAQPSANSQVDARLQVRNMIHDPAILPALAGDAAANIPKNTLEMIGVLGWMDTAMPMPYYLAMALVLGIALTGEMANLSTLGPSRLADSKAAIILLSAFLSWVCVFAIEYLVWTPVGARAIFGVQGRYFIPLALAAGIGIPCVMRSERYYRWAVRLVVAGQALTIITLPLVILARYYAR